MARKYPIGLQSFRSIREGGFLYIDKTKEIHQLVETGKYYFLSRPRRFGKSLLVNTIEELFKGSKELFEGLWIYDHWDWTTTNPVIHFNFSGLGVHTLGLEAAIRRGLASNAAQLGATLSETSYDQQLKELINQVSVSGKAVVLIDEYDKPLIDLLDNEEQLEENRMVMKNFYSVLKELDGKIRFLLMTGVSQFSRVSIFSDLNNLEDISVGRNFHTIAGITQQELERDFKPEIVEMSLEYPNLLNQIKEWYNGYSWAGNETLYNPFSLLNFMKSGEFKNFWFATGTPTFLLNQLKKRKLSDLDGVRATANALTTFDTDNFDMPALLFQTGYLTVKSELIKGQLYVLGYPNREVKESLLDGLLNVYREPVSPDSMALVYDLRMGLVSGNTQQIVDALNSLIGHIPYDHWRGDTESVFTIITVLTFRLAGVEVYTEVHSSKGRCDVLVKTEGYIYIIELKLDSTAEEAINQIYSRNYLQPYTSDKRKKIALGITFSSAERKITSYIFDEIT